MGNVAQTKIAINKYVQPLTFTVTNITDANGTLNTMNGGVTGYTMPYDGSIFAVAVSGSGTLATGTLNFVPTVNGTLAASTVNGTLTAFDDTEIITTELKAYATANARVYKFRANDLVGLAWQKTGTISPTTTDWAGQVFILFEGVNL
jgi:hypothetical protein